MSLTMSFSTNIFFLSEEVLVGKIMDISFMVELDRIFGVDISFEAVRSLEVEGRGDV